MQRDQIQSTTAAIHINGDFVGSGTIFIDINKLYCVTAAHNIYGLKLNEDRCAEEIHVVDYFNNRHSVIQINGEKSISIKHDIALLTLESDFLTGFATLLFSAIPKSDTIQMRLRGYYDTDRKLISWGSIKFIERKVEPSFYFQCEIEKQNLVNHNFSAGSEWLSGTSGSGLFYAGKKDLILIGVLIEIPNKGNDGKLLFCSIEILNTLGLNLRILPGNVFEVDTDSLDEDWFKHKANAAISALGPRYTPNLNFTLPIAKVFNGLSRNSEFKSHLDKYFEFVYEKRRRCYNSFKSESLSEILIRAQRNLNLLKNVYLGLNISGNNLIDYTILVDYCSLVNADLNSQIDGLYDEQEFVENANPTPRHSERPYQSSINELYALRAAIDEFSGILQSITCKVSNEPFIIMKGEAGFGKSHLLADIVTKRAEEGKLSVLLLGQHFVSLENPWFQILKKILQIPGNENHFLTILDAKAQLSGNRIIIFIDAINEGNGRIIWKDHLESFIQTIRHYQWLGVVVSIRTSYYEAIVNRSILDNQLAYLINHRGFADLEFEASEYFFDNYGIKRPSIPLLHPEFRSPLFLKLFCEGLKAKQLVEVPRGYSGITAILNFYLDGINDKLSSEYNYSKVNLVRTAVYALAERISLSSESYIELENAVYFLDSLPKLQIITNRNSFITSLIHEGVLSKNIYYKIQSEPEEGIYFTYERFFDHLVAANLLQGIKRNPMRDFAKKGKLFQYVRDVDACYANQGLVEAFSVQIPEKYDLELFDVVPHIRNTFPIARAFVQSIAWRKSDSFREKILSDTTWKKLVVWLKGIWTAYPAGSKETRLLEYLQKVVFKENELEDTFLQQILTIGSIPGHFFSADFLHMQLMQQSMTERDGSFLPWLNSHSDRSGPVTRIVGWSWKDQDRSYLTDESILLTCTLLTWFFISSNRKLRDGATKAAICLLQYRPKLLVPLLKKFEGVNDPYVFERLIGVAYGCTLRIQHHEFLSELCEYLFSAVFDRNPVYPHLLVRDYAKGIIEFATYKNIKLSFDSNVAFPPYDSDPITNYPTNEEIHQRYWADVEVHPHSYYQKAILESMITEYGHGTGRYGDFGRYVFERALNDWDVQSAGLSNYAIQRIFEIGYKLDIHGIHEENIRDGKENERIGKKYQWIAMMEILARVADHAKLYGESDFDHENEIPYLGAWQPEVRDIDLSLVIRKTSSTENNASTAKSPWWVKLPTLLVDLNNNNWMQSEDDIPKIEDIILSSDEFGNSWISLQLMLNIEDSKRPGEDPYEGPNKRMYLQVRAYLIASDEFENFRQFGQTADFGGRWMPEPAHKTGIFSREYYWSEGYKYNQAPYFGGNGDEVVYSQVTREFIANVHVPVEEFYWEQEFDYSKEATITFYRPSQKLWNGLQLSYDHHEGQYVNKSGEIDCVDPSVNVPGPSSLLVRKSSLLNFLINKHYKICWTVTGEKQILGSSHGLEDAPHISHLMNGFYWLEGETLMGQISSTITPY